MTATRFRNTEVRLSAALAATRSALDGRRVTLRELLVLVGEQGLLVFCALLSVPMLLPIPLPLMSYVLGMPILLIGAAVALNRVPWLPDRLLDRVLPGETVDRLLERAIRAAARFEHLVKPRMLSLTTTPAINAVNGAVISIAALTLLVPLPLVPFTNSLPGLAIMLLCLGMAERDGVLILLGHTFAWVSVAFVGIILWLAAKAGSDPQAALEMAMSLLRRLVRI
jgi:hypothetical protein